MIPFALGGSAGTAGATGATGADGVASVDAPALAQGYCWLRGENLTGADGTAISFWRNDVSGAWDTTQLQNHARQATSGMRPTMQTVGGKRVARFDGTDDQLLFDRLMVGVAWSVYFVFTPATIGAVERKIFTSQKVHIYQTQSADSKWCCALNSGNLSPAVLVAGTKYLLEVHQYAADDIDCVQNGVTTHYSSGSSLYNDSYTYIGAHANGTLACDFDLYEWFICPVSGIPQRDFLREYFRTKFTIY